MKKCMGCMRDYSEDKQACPVCGYSPEQMELEIRQTPYALSPGTILDGRYIVGRTLSLSDYSITYIAWDALLLKRVAMKEYFPNGFCERVQGEVLCSSEKTRVVFEAGRSYFEEEIRIINQNQDIHGIVEVYRCIRENGTSYMVMEYLEGGILTDFMEKREYPGRVTVKHMIKDVMETIAMLHDRGIGHYNISPENIYINEQGQCRLIDFGYAKLKLRTLTDTLYLFDEYYTAPELLCTDQAYLTEDRYLTADMYSVGTTYYSLLTGMHPPESLERQRKPKPLRMKNSGTEAVINRLADPDPKKRVQNIREVLQF